MRLYSAIIALLAISGFVVLYYHERLAPMRAWLRERWQDLVLAGGIVAAAVVGLVLATRRTKTTEPEDDGSGSNRLPTDIEEADEALDVVVDDAREEADEAQTRIDEIEGEPPLTDLSDAQAVADELTRRMGRRTRGSRPS